MRHSNSPTRCAAHSCDARPFVLVGQLGDGKFASEQLVLSKWCPSTTSMLSHSVVPLECAPMLRTQFRSSSLVHTLERVYSRSSRLGAGGWASRALSIYAVAAWAMLMAMAKRM